ncbi:TetR/AcrR family transcriptional regulator [Actinoplanes derwentensis]|uniref:DNA-binding transcriptional regulator, AcrR family n=1 Tax=Actinoplanes derwentensis TaxID=113562 RepID=A0A1H1V9J5_9ACTN|nr:TetR/AcrR family transcriptional regulator [Actinoplanes derwentensis]GID89266.1 TetR family transcriptional regulator [Actinoplanes derwentensis]SDS81171.1 DNA-binding transcriptional regulator, AcrR family [Actinoplanes derwentensis]
MRADAQRNAVKLRTAASELFQEHGLQVSLKEIARRAGVSHGTLYNLFGSREVLIDEVIADLAATRLSAAATRALASADPWQGFAGYLTEVCELQATDPALGDVLTRRYPDASRLMAVCDNSYAATEAIIARAHHDGSLRPDFTASDLLSFLASHAPLARATASTGSEAWRRQITFMLDGLRTAAATHPLPAAPLTPAQINHLLIQES